jgi:hypothetical protein
MYKTWHHTLYLYIPVRIWFGIGSPHSFVCSKRRLNGAVLRKRPVKQVLVSQQLWHNKDPSRLKGFERRTEASILQPFSGNGNVPILGENIFQERDLKCTVNKQIKNIFVYLLSPCIFYNDARIARAISKLHNIHLFLFSFYCRLSFLPNRRIHFNEWRRHGITIHSSWHTNRTRHFLWSLCMYFLITKYTEFTMTYL